MVMAFVSLTKPCITSLKDRDFLSSTVYIFQFSEENITRLLVNPLSVLENIQ